jgi:hypothetical protein
MTIWNHEPDDGCAAEGAERRCYSPEALPLLQSLLATLADLDFAYERERDRTSRSTQDPSVRARALRTLEVAHQERREPYIRHLTLLQGRTMPTPAVREEPLTTREEGSRSGRMVESTSRWTGEAGRLSF